MASLQGLKQFLISVKQKLCRLFLRVIAQFGLLLIVLILVLDIKWDITGLCFSGAGYLFTGTNIK
jgi:hypothetical protein